MEAQPNDKGLMEGASEELQVDGDAELEGTLPLFCWTPEHTTSEQHIGSSANGVWIDLSIPQTGFTVHECSLDLERPLLESQAALDTQRSTKA